MITRDPKIIVPEPGELLPCPFCGSEAGLEHDESSLSSWHVYCRDQHAATPCPIGMTNTLGYARRVEAATAWNKRK
jgi:Restriction alleviation protein Lar